MDETTRARLQHVIPWILGLSALGLLGVMLRHLGWQQAGESRWLALATATLSAFYAGALVLKVFTHAGRAKAWRRNLPLLILAGILIIESSGAAVFTSMADNDVARNTALIVLGLSQIPVLVDALIRLVILSESRFVPKLAPGALFLGSFVLLIAVGTCLLKLPRATVAGISWIDALFTSTSAACVTGLVTVDPAQGFTLFGQVIILLLIQAGGLGVMTLTYFVAMIAGQGVSLRDRVMLKEMLNEESLSHVGPMVRRIVGLTIAIEVVGAVLIYLSWLGKPASPGSLVWHSVFHSISAFCNAGFSTLPGGLVHGSTVFNISFQLIIMILIIAGGLGFGVFHESWSQVHLAWRRKYPGRRRRPLPLRFSVHWRLAMGTTLILVLGGTLMIGICELVNHRGATPPPFWLWWQSLFNSVTCRTAGFNATDMGGHAVSTALVMMFLMFIGGSPGGTAGGIKTTTFAISLLEFVRMLMGRDRVAFASRSVSRDVIDRCFSTLVISMAWIGSATLAITMLEPAKSLVDISFETISAFGTVGLTRGITTSLTDPSKLILCLTMLAGRVGILSFVLAFTGRPRPRPFTYPEARLPLN